MKYEKLVTRLAEISNQPVEAVRNILFAIPDVLVAMNEKDMVRTPMGVFRMTKRSSRMVKPPLGGDPVTIPEELVVKLRAGNRLRKGST